jgi:hypothetical protein
MRSTERAHLKVVLRLCGGNRERAAAALGISPATLSRRIEKLEIKGFEVRALKAESGQTPYGDSSPAGHSRRKIGESAQADVVHLVGAVLTTGPSGSRYWPRG